MSPRPKTFAEKLQRLLALMHAPGEPPLSDRALSRAIKQQGGQVSAAYLAELRTGRKTNPSLEQTRAIADAFGIRPGYFLDDEVAEAVDRDLDKVQARHRAEDLRDLVARTASLESEDRDLLAGLVQKELDKRRTIREDGEQES